MQVKRALELIAASRGQTVAEMHFANAMYEMGFAIFATAAHMRNRWDEKETAEIYWNACIGEFADENLYTFFAQVVAGEEEPC